METVTFSTEDIELATKEANKLGVLKKSFTKGDGNLASQLAEIAACRYLGVEYGKSTFNYDLVYKNQRIDVKCKRCTSKPRENYLVSIATCTKTQNCDIYLFARILAPQYTEGWLLGWLPQEKFFEYALYFDKGDIDPYGDGTWTFKESGYQLPISELYPMRKLKE